MKQVEKDAHTLRRAQGGEGTTVFPLETEIL